MAPQRFNATTVIPVMDELKINVSKARQELTIGGASPKEVRTGSSTGARDTKTSAERRDAAGKRSRMKPSWQGWMQIVI